MRTPGNDIDAARHLTDMPVAQLKALAEWAQEGVNIDPHVRLYVLPEDGSIDIAQGDAYTNIEKDGRDVG